jgi:HTH-type transcriptional regulator/antitoxin HigA
MKYFEVLDKNRQKLTPAVSVHPGSVLADEIEARGLKKAVFARSVGLSPSQLSELLHQKRHVSALLSLRLEAVLEIEAEFWLRLQVSYDLAQARMQWQRAA